MNLNIGLYFTGNPPTLVQSYSPSRSTFINANSKTALCNWNHFTMCRKM